MGAYYLDDRLSLIEGTRQFSDDGRGGGAPQEGFYGIAIANAALATACFGLPTETGPARA